MSTELNRNDALRVQIEQLQRLLKRDAELQAESAQVTAEIDAAIAAIKKLEGPGSTPIRM